MIVLLGDVGESGAVFSALIDDSEDYYSYKGKEEYFCLVMTMMMMMMMIMITVVVVMVVNYYCDHPL